MHLPWHYFIDKLFQGSITNKLAAHLEEVESSMDPNGFAIRKRSVFCMCLSGDGVNSQGRAQKSSCNSVDHLLKIHQICDLASCDL